MSIGAAVNVPRSHAPFGPTEIKNCFLIKVNRHKHGFNGTICKDPRGYQCGASDNFRARHCALGVAECFDMNMFAPQNPAITRQLNYDGSELLKTISTGDLLFFWTYQTQTKPAMNPILVGLYVVDSIHVDAFRMPEEFTFYPRADAMMYIDFGLPADKLLNRAIGEFSWAKQFATSDVSWALGLVQQGFEDQARHMTNRKNYESQIKLLDQLIDAVGLDINSPLYSKMARAGVLDLELTAPDLQQAETTPSLPEQRAANPAAAEQEVPGKSPAERLTTVAARYQLHYPAALLTRFHITMATHPFVVLSGHSGTGKTQLSRVYAEAERAAYQLVKVQPDWVSPSYLWGVYDYLAKCFAPTEFALLVREAQDEWERAEQEQRQPRKYVLCLDEMNLARVEYYLADILSAMEQPVADRWVTLYSSALEDMRGFPSRVRLTPNVRFVGTINVDETTHSLSPKVLDRTQIIRLDQVDLAALHTLLTMDPEGGIDRYVLDFVFLHLDEIHRRMADDPTQQFGYRVARQIVAWVGAATRPPYNLPMETALDAEICQKLLPRLQIDPDSAAQMAMFEKLLTYFEQFERVTPGFDETLRWLRSRQEQLGNAEAISGQQ